MKHLWFIHLQRGFFCPDHQNKPRGRRQKALRSQIWRKNAFLHKLTTLHRQKPGRFPVISTVSVLDFFFAVDVSWAQPSGAVSHGSEETTMSLGQLEPYHLLWMWLMCRFRCRGQAVHSAGLGFLLLLLLRLHFFPPSQKANRHVITQHLCTARTPSGIHLASAAHSAALTAPFFLHTCYSQEVEVVLNDDRNLPLPHGWGPTVNCAEVMKTLRMSEPEGHLEGDMETLRNAFPGGFSILVEFLWWIGYL